MIEALLVIDEKRRGLLGLEGRKPGILTSPPLQRHLARYHLADGQPSADFVEESGGIAHRNPCPVLRRDFDR